MGNKWSSAFSGNRAKGRWRGNFLTASLRRRSSLRRMSWVPQPHLDCTSWLSALDLLQYEPVFRPFSGVEEFLFFDEAQMKELGVKAANHRLKIMASLDKLRKKYEKCHKLKGVDPNPRTSLIEKSERRSSQVNGEPFVFPPSDTASKCPQKTSADGSNEGDGACAEAVPSLALGREALTAGQDAQCGPSRRIPSLPGVDIRPSSSLHRRDVRKRNAVMLSSSKVMSLPNPSSESAVTSGAELSQLLEQELSLSSDDLRSHAWYHGSIPRQRAEEIVLKRGQFLIRDCNSQPGDFVLTCCWNGQPLHFVVQKSVLQPDTIYERIQYKLEDEGYDTIPDLVRSYVGSRRPVTLSSGARIAEPVNRQAPLSFYANTYCLQTAHTMACGTLSRPAARSSDSKSSHARQPLSSSPQVGLGCSLTRNPPHSPPRGPRDQGVPTDASTQEDKVGGSSGDRPAAERPKGWAEPPSFVPFSKSASPPPRPSFASLILTADGQEAQQDPRSASLQAPPKPSRVPSFKVKPKRPQVLEGERIPVYQEIEDDPCKASPEPSADPSSNPRHSRLSEVYNPSESDSGNGSGDSILTSESDPRNRDSQVSFGDSGSFHLEEDSVVEDDTLLFQVPPLEPPSAFDLENFCTLLLPSVDNKPLDATALRGVRNMLTECGSRILAAHLTRVDLDLLHGPADADFGLGVTSGIELIALPQGSQLRRDLIDRTETLKLFVAVTVLKTADMEERAEMIHHWIQVALDTKAAMGNLYGFTGIMLGLCVPEIQRLGRTWHLLRQRYTDSAFAFESKLRFTMKAMNECTNPQAPNTTIPHLLPFCILWERDLEEVYSLHTKGSALFQWESTASDYGLQMLLSHLEEARAVTQNLSAYRHNAALIVGNWGRMDELTLDMFRTEFHLKLLFGSRGALADSEERIAKFQKILTTLSAFCEPLQDETAC